MTTQATKDRHRRDSATAAVGLTGVGTAAGLRHVALDRAYAGKPRPKFPLWHERKLLTRGAKGRVPYLAATGLGLLSVPAAGVGINNRLTKRDEPRRSFVGEGVSGARDSLGVRNKALQQRGPAGLVLGNWAAGAAIGSAGGGITHRLLRPAHLPGTVRAAMAAAAGTTIGAASLPAQSKVTERLTHGKYRVTPVGVSRTKTKRVAPSRRATVVEARPNKAGYNPSLIRSGDVGKYYGEDMTHGQKRARVAAVTGPPIIGDIAQAAQAARMAPPALRHSTAAQTYGGGQVGGVTGQTAGAYGAAALAARSPGFDAKAKRVSDAIDRGKAGVRAKIGLKPRIAGPGRLERAAASEKVPKLVRGFLKPIARNPKVAGIGMLAGGAIGGNIGSQSGYGAALHAEDRYKAKIAKAGNASASHGTRVAKATDPTLLTHRERTQLSRRKKQNAALSQVGGTTGLASLGALLASKSPKLAAKTKARLSAAQTPLLTVGGGLGGVNAYIGAAVQHKEAQVVGKGYLSATGSVVRRSKSVRSGTVRRTRVGPAIRTSVVRGGLA